MKKKLLAGLATCLFLLGTVGLAQATLVDFTATMWSNVNGTQSQSNVIDGWLTVQLDVLAGGNLTWNGNDPNGQITLPDGLGGHGDGIGISDDEVSNNERLKISFSPDVIVNEIYLLDLFNSEGGQPEVAKFTFDGTTWTSVNGGSDLNGYVSIATGNSNSQYWVEFATNNSSVSDFAVAGMDVAQAPEPATMLLLGTGLAGLAGYRTRRKKMQS